MANLADKIERYLKDMLGQTAEGFVVLQRGTLAHIFSCAPSQINYVLTTRFTVERGYLVESRRGGGGYLRIVRLGLDTEGNFRRVMSELIGDELTPDRCRHIIAHLEEEEILTERECALLRSVMAENTLALFAAHPQRLRAALLKEVLTTICRDDLNPDE
ncbi:MAG: CtsR family transcriptional regulator [Gracilibacteraceae bacterium]|jgi:transcriptional regulator CtsR|nr:CtsR family transcriptional regulator [Gracilibacteraceae bacterium]